MSRSEYMKGLFEAWASCRISTEAYDAGCMNVDAFCDEDDEEES